MFKQIINSIKDKVTASVTMSKSTIKINGKSYSGSNVSVINDKVYIDGQLQDESSEEKIINITIEGSAENVSTISGDIQIQGGVSSSVVSTSGDIKISGNVNGNVSSVSGDISAKEISGAVSTISGDIN